MLENYIVSFSEGRIRLRHPAIKEAALATQVTELLQTFPGVESVQCNTRTFSLLVHYDPEILDKEGLILLLEQGEQWLQENYTQEVASYSFSAPPIVQSVKDVIQKPSKRTRKIWYRSMIFTLATTLITGGTGDKKSHIIAGGIFSVLTLGHMWRVRKGL